MTQRIIILVLALGLFACSKAPSDSTMEQLIATQILQGDAGQYIKIDNFNVSGGIQESDNTFIAELSYDLVFTKSLQEIKALKQAQAGEDMMDSVSNSFGVMALQMQHGDFPAGYRLSQQQNGVFVKTDSGWVLTK
ncbi:hypothetical protein [Motilimonas pumila]|uniref:Uncharacterized protein n=1 Tax=Motilimonas pumila TaxID=2303987 RepID=A0A418YIL0_9GAMM|nr:hypothetical protein [Motilimonas pumila]RJG50452.1 hypothetical protein D1Z90_02945 [Motilimonas pumila]